MTCILVADDEETVRLWLRQVLEGRGFDVIEAGNGNEVLHVLEAHGVDVLILDVMMPEKDGLETLMELKRRRIALPVIAMSGSRSTPVDFLKMAKEFGADQILYKPFTETQLLGYVTNALPSAD